MDVKALEGRIAVLEADKAALLEAAEKLDDSNGADYAAWRQMKTLISRIHSEGAEVKGR